MNLFYANPDDIQDGNVIVTGQEAEHITKVLRHSAGDIIRVTDGNGSCYEGKIINFSKSTVFLEILDVSNEPINEPSVCLCIGIIKKRDRLEFAVEKAIELGALKIVLFKGEHSQKENVRIDRLEKNAISAMKQSLRFYLPEIVVENSLKDAISHHAEDSTIIVADETKDTVDREKVQSEKYFLIVGPEGGFSNSEREYFQSLESVYYSLGEKRLRTETAAVVMVDRFVNSK